MRMAPEEALRSDQLAECVRRHLPDAELPVELTPIPTGKFNSGYFVRAGDEDLVLRVAPPKDSVFLFYEVDMMRQEPGIHRLLLEETAVPVAEIVAYDDSCEVIDRDFILMKRLPGDPLCDTPEVNTENVMRRVGECLAEVHALTAEQYGYIGEHRPMEPQPSWPEAFQIMWRKLIEDVGGTGHYDADECRSLVSLLDRHTQLFERPVASSLLHMDIWSQNILVDHAGHLTGLSTGTAPCGATRRSSSPYWTTAASPRPRSGTDTARPATNHRTPALATCSTCSTRCRSTSSSGTAGATTPPPPNATSNRSPAFSGSASASSAKRCQSHFRRLQTLC